MSTLTVNLPRGHHDASSPCWVPTVSATGKRSRPLIKCVCGQLYGTRAHHIHKDGTVTKSWHSNVCCGWHVFLTLLDWPGDDFPPSP
jgi:hypothetical protein